MTLTNQWSWVSIPGCLPGAGFQPHQIWICILWPKPEWNYTQIEREMLTIAFDCTRFHCYVYGREEVLVETDHKRRKFLFKKAIVEVPPCIQWILKVQCNGLDVYYRAGKELLMADTLRWTTTLPPKNNEDQFEVFLINDLIISSGRQPRNGNKRSHSLYCGRWYQRWLAKWRWLSPPGEIHVGTGSFGAILKRHHERGRFDDQKVSCIRRKNHD